DEKSKLWKRIKANCLVRKEKERQSKWSQRLAWGCAAGAVVGAVTMATAGTIGVGAVSVGVAAPIGGVTGAVVGGILGCASGALVGAASGAAQDLVFGTGNPEQECSKEADDAFK